MASSDKTEVNYLYFCFFFLFVFALTFSHFIHASQPLWGVPLFFLLYAGVQALLEVFSLMLIGSLLHRWMPSWTFRFYIVISFVFLLAHFANFTLIRIMDVPLSYCFKVFFGRGIDHFQGAVLATGLNPTVTKLIIAVFILVPIVGLFFYWATHKLSQKIPIRLSYWRYTGVIGVLSLVLLLLDFLAKPYLTADIHNKYSKTLPLCSTFLYPEPRVLPLDAPLKPPRKEEDLRAFIAERQPLKMDSLPNLYLFVIETLRKDCIDEKTAPHLSAFARENFAPSLSYTNANFTAYAWFSLFHSAYPHYWTFVRDHWNKGSVPLQLLKKLGYNIRVYSSADLTYFGMNRILFGEHLELVNGGRDFFSSRVEAWERDAFCIKALTKDLDEHAAGNLFIVFLDSTHSEYSSPDHFEKPFMPAATSIDYLGITRSPNDLELLKNRYRNSVFWVDHLMGSFLHSLKEKGLYDDAVIVVTGDHAEEFLEERALFHGTHLNDWQTKVPLLYKFPGYEDREIASLSTHLDIFPSILHYLTGCSDYSSLFDGESIFALNRWGFAFTMQHNGVDTPYEFRLFNGETELIGRFLNPPNIFSIPAIELVSLKGSLPSEEEKIRNYFNVALRLLVRKNLPKEGEAFVRESSNLLEVKESKRACETQ